MAVKNLNHINIRAAQPLLDEIKAFYVNVVGLEEGPRPDVPVPGYWLYAGDSAIVHLMDSAYRGLDENALSTGASHLDHFAFTCSDIEATADRLKAMNVEFRRNDAPEFGISQLFLTDPTGLGVELNFPHGTGN